MDPNSVKPSSPKANNTVGLTDIIGMTDSPYSIIMNHLTFMVPTFFYGSKLILYAAKVNFDTSGPQIPTLRVLSKP